MSKNLKAKTRKVDNPYEIYKAGDWEWRVLKHYQTPEKEKTNKYARVFTAVKTPMTYGSWEYGDSYLADIVQYGVLTFIDGTVDIKE
jgi:hypothetical protein